MPAKILFASVEFDRLSPEATLPAKFSRMLGKLSLGDKLGGKTVAIKMHVGRGVGYTTIHPLFVRDLVNKCKAAGAKRVFVTDQDVSGAAARGYTQEFLGCPVVDMCASTGKYYYEKTVDFKTFKNVDVGGSIYDVDFLINLSHIKGHGCCGLGGAVKNIAMGCVTDRTRMQIHGLEGGLAWKKELCTNCRACVENCNHEACLFNDDGDFSPNYHHCTLCQHCVKVCPTGAISLDSHNYTDFQAGMAVCTQKCLEHFDKGKVLNISFLLDMTVMCDCWGFSTPSMIPDVGIIACDDIVAVEKCALDMMTLDNFNPKSLPKGKQLSGHGHLIEQVHGKDPWVQLDQLVGLGMGELAYTLEEVE